MASLRAFTKVTSTHKHSVGGNITTIGHFNPGLEVAVNDTIGPLYVDDLQSIVDVQLESINVDSCSTAAARLSVGYTGTLNAFINSATPGNSGAFARNTINQMGHDSLGNATIGSGYTFDRADSVTGGSAGAIYIFVPTAPTTGSNDVEMTLKVITASDLT